MTEIQEAEPPAWLRPPLFMVGQDDRGNWVVQDQSGARGGLFVNRAEALRYVRAENGSRPQAVILIRGILELDMGRTRSAVPHRQVTAGMQRERRVA